MHWSEIAGCLAIFLLGFVAGCELTEWLARSCTKAVEQAVRPLDEDVTSEP